MTAKYVNQELAKEICQAIGVEPGQTRLVDIKLQVGSLATVYVEKFLTPEEATAVAAVVKRYEFVLKDESQPSEVG